MKEGTGKKIAIVPGRRQSVKYTLEWRWSGEGREGLPCQNTHENKGSKSNAEQLVSVI